MPLSKPVKQEIRRAVPWTPAGDSCLRCDQPGHETLHCGTPIELCWKDGRFTDAAEAEQLYQDVRKTTKDNLAKKKASEGAKKAEKAAKKPAAKQPPDQGQPGDRVPLGAKVDTFSNKTNRLPAASTGKDQVKHLVKPKTTMIQPIADRMATLSLNHDATVETTKSTQTADDHAKTTKQVRIPIDTPGLGKIDRITTETPQIIRTRRESSHANDRKGANQGLYQGKTDIIDGKAGPRPGPSVRSNFVRVNGIPQQLFAYSLRFYRLNPNLRKKGDPAEFEYNKSGEVKSAFEAFCRSNMLDLTNVIWATDYKELWCTSRLSVDPKDPTASQAAFQDIKWNCPGARAVGDLKLDIAFIKQMDIHDSFKQKASCDLSDEIRALNAIISSAVHTLNSGLIQVGVNKFFVRDAFRTMTGGLRAQRGYFTSVRPSVSGPLLNINTATATFLPPMLVSDFLACCLSERSLGGAVEVTRYVERMLKNRTVRIVYRRQNYDNGKDMNSEHSRLKVFKHFGAATAEQLFFEVIQDAEGKETIKLDDEGTSVYNLFTRQMRPAVATDQGTLCVNVGKPSSSTKKMDEQSVRGAIWIPANLLEILPDQTANVELCSQHTADMITMALREPGYNAGLIDLEGLEKLGIKGDQAHLGKLSVAAGHDMIQFGASISPQPRITYGGGPQNRGPPVKIAAWNLANVKFAAPKNVAALHVLSGPSALFRGFVDVFAQEMAMTLGDLGIKILTDRSYNQEVGRGSISEELLAWFPTTKQGDCSVMVLKERSEDAYAAVKRAGDITFGQHTLCVVGTKINRKVGQLLNNGPDKRNYQQYLANLSLKVNMKMQGDNHHVDFQALGSLKSKTIVLGADVTHPGSDSSGRPSIACVVGSLDDHFMNYPGSIRLQAGGQEEIQNMRGMVKERLASWASTHGGRLPEYMVFYRDGISESQFRDCEKNEITAVRAAHADLAINQNKGAMLKVTFVIVGKRHNTRFYPTTEQNCTKVDRDPKRCNMNVTPGLLVDRAITDPDRYNFYLQSHQAIKGTARSAHYHVLVDEIGFGKNKMVGKLPDLTHQLCYAFGRATRGVSYVAPAYIADRLCERGRVYLRGWLGQGLEPFKLKKKEGAATKEVQEKQWKEECARMAMEELVFPKTQERLWGHCGKLTPEGRKRMNPWHPDMDKVMFWM